MTPGKSLRFCAHSGMTMVEMLTGIAVATVVLTLSYKVFLAFKFQTITQSRIAVKQDEFGPLQVALEKTVRRASFGIPMKVERRISSTVRDTLQSLSIADNGSSPDGLKVSGNFSGVESQLRLACLTGAANMELLTGTAGGFVGATTVIVNDGDYSEWLTVNSVDVPNSRLSTSTRLRDYPMGAQVIRVTVVEFRPNADTLSMLTDGRAIKLTKSLSDLRFYCILSNGTTDSVPPFDAYQVKFIKYRVKIRISKARNSGYLYREATSRVLLRNIQ